ncbi:SLOG family protein [Streptomyces sp. 8L]|uniref:SLOG family protein n=1 Tax=Streptomyces sp. 8L TaxID=2877242 RepID=UPI001CD43209|nr:SLOG family protein [Streptomyces sp. 8L]MCA1223447.1 DUF2493 domain-containing protein [Streptomyces sp. 8L]
MTGPNLARILVTGSRSWPDPQLLAGILLDTWHDTLQDGYDGMLLTHGAAEDGADTLADIWAHNHGIPTDPHPADWPGPCTSDCPPDHRRRTRGRNYCPWAGHRRNQEMIDLAPLLVVGFSHQNSRGTADCLRRARKAGISTRVITA